MPFVHDDVVALTTSGMIVEPGFDVAANAACPAAARDGDVDVH